MLLQAVIVPPPEVRAAVARVVGSIESVPVVAAAQHPSRGLFRRAPPPQSPPPPVVEDELDLLPTTLMNLPIAQFGNVTAGDSARLAAVLKDAALDWPHPTVHLAGGAALEFPGDRSVWARLDGDVDGIEAVARGVVRSVASRGFFVDRRSFRPWLAVATITQSTTAPHLERVVEALDAFRGEPWTVVWVSVTKPSFGLALGGSREVYRIPLAMP